MSRRKSPDTSVVPFPAPRLPPDSEEAIALDFARLRQPTLRYIAVQRQWMEWDGVTWRKDRLLAAFNAIRCLTRATADRIQEGGGRNGAEQAARIASARTVAAVERLAQSDPRLAATTDIWDTDPMLLATPAGHVDLTTGSLSPALSERYVTRLTLVGPDAEGRGCAGWTRFLEEVCGGDPELAAYLQRVAGYCLTGRTQEHALFFLLGTGRNGKSVFVNTLRRILGDYAAVAPMDALTEARGERHPTDLAMLKGCRMASALETDAGRPWAEAKVKLLTGGDPVTARFMRQDFFTYTPQFKLVIAGNKEPQIRTRDAAMRARIQFIPFPVTIPESRRDRTLQERLIREEAAGILSWAIEGCLEWQQIGLAPPTSVRSFSAARLGQEDPIERWIGACCSKDETAKVAFADLFDSWSRWARANGELAGTERSFAMNLSLRNFKPARLPGGAAARLGLSLAGRAHDAGASDRR